MRDRTVEEIVVIRGYLNFAKMEPKYWDVDAPMQYKKGPTPAKLESNFWQSLTFSFFAAG